jgi:hypothetical protein
MTTSIELERRTVSVPRRFDVVYVKYRTMPREWFAVRYRYRTEDTPTRWRACNSPRTAAKALGTWSCISDDRMDHSLNGGEI